jgi:hypothetical protein
MIEKSVYEVVKEYTIFLSATGYHVNARIMRNLSSEVEHRYAYETSYYYQSSEKVIVAQPADAATTFEDAEAKLLSYINNFTCTGIVPNSLY